MRTRKFAFEIYWPLLRIFKILFPAEFLIFWRRICHHFLFNNAGEHSFPTRIKLGTTSLWIRIHTSIYVNSILQGIFKQTSGFLAWGNNYRTMRLSCQACQGLKKFLYTHRVSTCIFIASSFDFVKTALTIILIN